MSSTTQMTSNKPTSGLLALDEDAQLVLPGAETAQIQREFVSVGLFDDHEDGAMRIAMVCIFVVLSTWLYRNVSSTHSCQSNCSLLANLIYLLLTLA